MDPDRGSAVLRWGTYPLTTGNRGGTLEAMRILTRYLLRLHVAPFLFAVTGLTLLLLLDQVSRRFRDLIGKDLHWAVIVEVFAYSVPFILAQTLPMAVLIATLFTFNRLAGDLEITAMRASGIPLSRMMVPILVAATILAGAMTWFNNTILPESNHDLQVLLTGIGRKKPTFYLRERTINEVLPSRLYVQPGGIDRERSALRDVVLYDERDGQRSRTVYADSGSMAFDAAGEDLYLLLDRGTLQERPNETPDMFQRIHFERLMMRVEGVSNQLERDTLSTYRSDREMNVRQMREEVSRGQEQVSRARAESRAYAIALVRQLTAFLVPTEAVGRDARRDPEPRSTVTDPAIAPSVDPADTARIVDPADKAAAVQRDSAAIESGRAAQQFSHPVDGVNQFGNYLDRENRGLGDVNKYWVEIHKKGSIPAACIVFVLIGAPIAIRYPRAGVALVVGVSLLFFGAYYVSLVGGEELADRRFMSPLWAMWAPNILFGAIGVVALVQATRVR